MGTCVCVRAHTHTAAHVWRLPPPTVPEAGSLFLPLCCTLQATRPCLTVGVLGLQLHAAESDFVMWVPRWGLRSPGSLASLLPAEPPPQPCRSHCFGAFPAGFCACVLLLCYCLMSTPTACCRRVLLRVSSALIHTGLETPHNRFKFAPSSQPGGQHPLSLASPHSWSSVKINQVNCIGKRTRRNSETSHR